MRESIPEEGEVAQLLVKLHNEGEVAQKSEGEVAQLWVKLHNEDEVAQIKIVQLYFFVVQLYQ